jgi:sialate O-acetylesterase
MCFHLRPLSGNPLGSLGQAASIRRRAAACYGARRSSRWARQTALVFALVAALAPLCAANVRPSGIFSRGAVLQRDRPIPVWGFGADGERVTVTLRDRHAVAVAAHGRWSVRLPPTPAGGPYTLTIEGRNRVSIGNVLVGDVYLCGGEANMEWPLALAAGGTDTEAEAADPLLRLCTVPRGVSDMPAADVSVQWQPGTPEFTRGFSAVAYYFGKALRRRLHVPIGLIQCAWSGSPAQAWTSRAALESDPELSRLLTAYDEQKAAYRMALDAYDRYDAQGGRPPGAPIPPGTSRLPPNPTDKNSPAVLYNAMIAPLAPYAIRGAIWYQGESDAGTPSHYRTLFPAMIAGWRTAWKQGDFPCLYVQLAPFMRRVDAPQESAWAELRDAQLQTLRTTPNVGMAVITDLGDETDIHPRDKQPVGERLALLARSIVYKEDVEAYGPIYDSATREGSAIVVHFQHVDGGLEARGGSLTGFAIAGEDGVFVNATAVIRSGDVVVSSPLTPQPVAVRYGWADFPQGSLWNRAGLPASPFRTGK